MNRTYRYVFFSFAEMYVETRISNEPRLVFTVQGSKNNLKDANDLYSDMFVQ